MLTERLELDLLEYQVARFGRLSRSLAGRLESFFEWHKVFSERLYMLGVPFLEAIENLKLPQATSDQIEEK
jgi:hypothetical protein